MLRIGNKGFLVKNLQKALRSIGYNIIVDGVYGVGTKFAVIDFQKKNGLITDGIVGEKTRSKINTEVSNKALLFPKEFTYFADMAHGINTPGKRAYHKGYELHQGGWYYEWYESFLIQQEVTKRLTRNHGIKCVYTKANPTLDSPLRERAKIVREWLDLGYYGWLNSVHTNAISSKNSDDKKEATRGFMIFNTPGQNLSDTISDYYHKQTAKVFGNHHTRRKEDRKDGDVDFERNFTINKETDLEEYDNFCSTLSELDFHTSAEGCKFIIENRSKHVDIIVQTALFARTLIQTQMK